MLEWGPKHSDHSHYFICSSADFQHENHQPDSPDGMFLKSVGQISAGKRVRQKHLEKWKPFKKTKKKLGRWLGHSSVSAIQMPPIKTLHYNSRCEGRCGMRITTCGKPRCLTKLLPKSDRGGENLFVPFFAPLSNEETMSRCETTASSAGKHAAAAIVYKFAAASCVSHNYTLAVAATSFVIKGCWMVMKYRLDESDSGGRRARLICENSHLKSQRSSYLSRSVSRVVLFPKVSILCWECWKVSAALIDEELGLVIRAIQLLCKLKKKKATWSWQEEMHEDLGRTETAEGWDRKVSYKDIPLVAPRRAQFITFQASFPSFFFFFADHVRPNCLGKTPSNSCGVVSCSKNQIRLKFKCENKLRLREEDRVGEELKKDKASPLIESGHRCNTTGATPSKRKPWAKKCGSRRVRRADLARCGCKRLWW